MNNNLDKCILLIEKDYDDWLEIINSCPSYSYFKHIMALAILKSIAIKMKEPNESELARLANMNRQTLGMFMKRFGLGSSVKYFWGLE